MKNRFQFSCRRKCGLKNFQIKLMITTTVFWFCNKYNKILYELMLTRKLSQKFSMYEKIFLKNIRNYRRIAHKTNPKYQHKRVVGEQNERRRRKLDSFHLRTKNIQITFFIAFHIENDHKITIRALNSICILH